MTTIRVVVPKQERVNSTNFMASVMAKKFSPSLIDLPAMVVVNERTGSIIVTGDVEISAVTVGNDKLVIQTTTPPITPTAQDPVVTKQTWTEFGTTGTSSDRARIQDLLEAFKQLNVPTKDQISILSQINQSGKASTPASCWSEPSGPRSESMTAAIASATQDTRSALDTVLFNRPDNDQSRADFASVLGKTQNDPNEDPATKARRTAENFVSIALVQPLLKQLRESDHTAAPFGPSDGEKQFRGLMDAQLAQRVVRAAHFPLVERIASDLAKRAGRQPGSTDAPGSPPPTTPSRTTLSE